MITKKIVNPREFSKESNDTSKVNRQNMCFQKVLRHICYLIALLCLMIIASPVERVKAATLSIEVDGAARDYTGKQVYVNFDGKKVSMKNTPGIILNGISYVSYKNVFGDSKIDAAVSYNSKTKEITISKYDKTIVMKLGSKTATINGQTTTMPGAPIKVKYVSKKITKILVPTEFLAKALGYEFSWSATTDRVNLNINPGMIIRYNGKTYSYTGTKANVTIDGKTISLSTLPGIIKDNSVLLQAKKVFTSSPIGAEYTYDKAKKEVTLTKDDITIVLTIGSKTALINGTKQTMPTSPLVIKNVVTGKSYVCIPAEFVSKSLGLGYVWDRTTKTSTITTKTEDKNETTETIPTPDDTVTNPDNGGEPTKPEDNQTQEPSKPEDNQTQQPPEQSGSNNNIVYTGTLKEQYYDLYHYIKEDATTKFDASSSNLTGYIDSISKNYSQEIDREIYTIRSQIPFSSIRSKIENQTLTITAENVMSYDLQYPFYCDLVTYAQSSYHPEKNASDIVFTLTSDQLAYDLSLSADMYTLTVTVYTNYIEKVEVGKNQKGEYITFYTLRPISPSINDFDKTCTVLLANTINGTGDLTFNSNELTKIQAISGIQVNNNDLLINIIHDPTTTYKVEKGTNNTYTILFTTDLSDPNLGGDGSGIPSGDNAGNDTPELGFTGIKIPMPSGYSESQVTNEDLYLEKKIKLSLPGDQTTTINSSTIMQNCPYISSIQTTYTNNQTVIIISTNRICGFKYIVKDGYLCVTIDRPSNVYDKIVVLDPGHGGTDTGAISPTKVYEKDLNYKILYTLAKEKFEQNGIKTYYTRTTDVKTDLYARPAFSDEVDADLFISLHMNSSTSASAQGTEVYYYSKEKASKTGLTGKTMATVLTNNLSQVMNTRNRGPKVTSGFVVVKYNTVPSVLIELGFLSNTDDLRKLVNENYQIKAAECIADTVSNFFLEYPTGR